MDARQIEVHSYYKDMYPNALVLYRLSGRYMVLGQDVETAQKSIPEIQIVDSGVGLLPDHISVLSTLGVDGAEIRTIQYRNDAGELDLPDVNRIKAEKDMDY